MARKITIEVIAAMLTLLFVYAALSKLLDFVTFRFQLGNAPYIGQFASFLAYALPILELAIVALLFLKNTRLLALWTSSIIMIVFTGYIALMLVSGKRLPCTCGGVIQKLSWTQHLLFNLLFTLISIAGIILYKRQMQGRGHNVYRLSVS